MSRMLALAAASVRAPRVVLRPARPASCAGPGTLGRTRRAAPFLGPRPSALGGNRRLLGLLQGLWGPSTARGRAPAGPGACQQAGAQTAGSAQGGKMAGARACRAARCTVHGGALPPWPPPPSVVRRSAPPHLRTSAPPQDAGPRARPPAASTRATPVGAVGAVGAACAVPRAPRDGRPSVKPTRAAEGGSGATVNVPAFCASAARCARARVRVMASPRLASTLPRFSRSRCRRPACSTPRR